VLVLSVGAGGMGAEWGSSAELGESSSGKTLLAVALLAVASAKERRINPVRSEFFTVVIPIRVGGDDN
jgi:hypothetical protein